MGQVTVMKVSEVLALNLKRLSREEEKEIGTGEKEGACIGCGKAEHGISGDDRGAFVICQECFMRWVKEKDFNLVTSRIQHFPN